MIQVNHRHRIWVDEGLLCKDEILIFLFLFLLLSAAVERSRLIAKQADIIAAMSLEVLKGTTRAFDSCEYKNHTAGE